MQNIKTAKQALKKSFSNFIEVMFISLAIIGLVFWLIGQPLEIVGDSMYPTYKDGEQIIAEKITYKLDYPQRGDVVIFKHPEHDGIMAIKRVIGMPFDKFQISEGKIYINGEEYDEPYLNNVTTEAKTHLKEGTEYLVPEDSYVLLGDNRRDSLDSRNWGFIKKENIIGKPVLVYLPTQNFRIVQ